MISLNDLKISHKTKIKEINIDNRIESNHNVVKNDISEYAQNSIYHQMKDKDVELNDLQEIVEKEESQEKQMLDLVRDKTALLNQLINNEKMDSNLRTYIN